MPLSFIGSLRAKEPAQLWVQNWCIKAEFIRNLHVRLVGPHNILPIVHSNLQISFCAKVPARSLVCTHQDPSKLHWEQSDNVVNMTHFSAISLLLPVWLITTKLMLPTMINLQVQMQSKWAKQSWVGIAPHLRNCTRDHNSQLTLWPITVFA